MQERGLVDSREQAKRLILAGQVRVNAQIVDKVAAQVDAQDEISIDQGPPFVSRGGIKLAEALRAFDIHPEGWVCADVGASTGGFTDCLLQHGAQRVYAIDVGYGQLAWKLRQDSCVVIMERTNARYLQQLEEQVRLVTIDASFISLRLLLPAVKGWLDSQGEVIALIKPQFEAGAGRIGKGGVVRDPETHRQVLRDILDWAIQNDWHIRGLVPSPIKGPKGNIEFLLWLGDSSAPQPRSISEWVDMAMLMLPTMANLPNP
jgi:23S rRNA (cytidine1920-2'-O)/16S rRNA (cytidine1409-2'-O)-methyltransferase